MEQTEEWPRQSPVVLLDGRKFTVDFAQQEFRGASNPLESIDFNSDKGRQMWDECMILACPKCGLVMVEQRYLDDIKCRRCGRRVLV